MNRLINITPKKSRIPQPQILRDYDNIMSNVEATTNYKQYISNYFNYIPYDTYINYWVEYSLANPTVSLAEYIYNTIYTFYAGQLFETSIKQHYINSNLLTHNYIEETEYIDHICKIDIELYTDTDVIGLQCKSKSFLNCRDTIKQYQIDNIINNYYDLYEADYNTKAYIVVYSDLYEPMKYNGSHLIRLEDVMNIHSKDLTSSTFTNLFKELDTLLLWYFILLYDVS